VKSPSETIRKTVPGMLTIPPTTKKDDVFDRGARAVGEWDEGTGAC
jgi:hypothetical protein